MSSTWTLEALKEHYDTILRDKKLLDDERFSSIDDKFEASDKAIGKAERAQEQYNVVHNDLVRKNELMQTRVDAEKDHISLENQLNSIRINLESQINSLRINVDEKFTNVNDKLDQRFKNVTDKMEGLRSGADKGEGKEAAYTKFIGWIVAAAIALISYFAKK